ncbi:MAG: hypothetical protein ABL912_01625 [Novosphingobium sp.]
MADPKVVVTFRTQDLKELVLGVVDRTFPEHEVESIAMYTDGPPEGKDAEVVVKLRLRKDK